MVCTFWCQHISSYNPKADSMFIGGQFICDATCTETTFRLLAKWTSPFKLAGCQFSRLLAAKVCASVVVIMDTPCSEVVWRVLATHSIRQGISPSLPLPCVAVCHHISTGLYNKIQYNKENSSFQQLYQKKIAAARQTWLAKHVAGWRCHNIQAHHV